MQVVEAQHSQWLCEAREQREQKADEMHNTDIECDEIHVQPTENDNGIDLTLKDILCSQNGNTRVLHRKNLSKNT